MSEAQRRIIPCLDVKGGRVVKGVRFEGLRDAGDPLEAARAHAEAGADQLCFFDIAASPESRGALLTMIERAARELPVPFVVGGGVRSEADVESLLRAGAGKVSLNTAALGDPALISAAARAHGSQRIVVAIDAKARGPGWEVRSHGGTRATGRDLLEWAREAESRGAGELLLTSIDHDGTQRGFSTALVRALTAAVTVPVIASGGAGAPEHFAAAFDAGASAAMAATAFSAGKLSIQAIKAACAARGFPMRGLSAAGAAP
jgi:cyclase